MFMYCIIIFVYLVNTNNNNNTFITMKISAFPSQEVGTIDSHVAFVLLRFCGGSSKLSYIARTPPPTMACATLKQFDSIVHHCFSECIGIDTTIESWLQG